MNCSVKLPFVFFLLLTVPLHSSYCQYNGGTEDGVDFGITIGSDLSGKISQTSIIYFGSFDEGSNFTTAFSVINGAVLNIYSGGNDEGSFNAHNSYAISGGNLSILYTGDSDEGTAIAFASQSPSGVKSASIYNGGFDDGHSLKPYSNLLKAQNPFSIYNGSSNDGHTSKSGYGVIASPGINMFNGSFDEGSDKVKYVGPLDLSAQNLLFKGGVNDGFVLKLESALFLSGGTTSVEKNIIDDIILFPNPLAGTEFYIRFTKDLSISDIGNVALYSLNGTKYPVNYSFSDKDLKIFLQKRLESGGYVITVYTTKGEMYKITFIAQ
jgi:hypothetical protein